MTWDDIDLDGHELHIDWTLGHVRHDMRWKPRPKSEAGKRTIALDPATVEALRAHRRAQLEQRLEAAEGWHNVKVLSQRLGHKSVGTTLDTYASVLPAVDHARARSYARVILG